MSATAEAPVTWRVAGSYSEACNCGAICPSRRQGDRPGGRSTYERLRSLGVHLTQEPAQMGPVTMAIFDDTCGNLIQVAAM